ncbi:NAD kinase [Tannerella sp. oral taxon 808]|nr:NAD kinase [Tannerella sp. oral taxon 808]PNE26343.1 NAD kinase [Tannerella sp. oral taxon 808]
MKIGIFGCGYRSDKLPLLRRLFEKLETLKAEIFVSRDFHAFLSTMLDFRPACAGVLSAPPFGLDIALSVGGDGTFLRTAEQIGRQDIPILGINTGRLGFLAEAGPEQIEETLDEISRGDYRIERRMMLCLQTSEPAFAGCNYALNEVALLKRETSSMITIHTFLNDEYLTSYQADGLVIASPTGSTAYSMSVNGPIILPQSDNIVLSPVAPHSLNVRPLVIPGSYKISLEVESRNDSYLVALDGRSESLSVDVRLSVCRADFAIQMISRNNRSFYRTLRDKLMWGADVRS